MDDRNAHQAYYGPPPPDLPPPLANKSLRKSPKQSPQAAVHQFWQRFSTQHPGKVFAVLPSNPHARRKRHASKSASGKHVGKSYDEARSECIRDVDRIIRECRRTNQKYRDLHFDIEWDLKSHQRNCLDGLSKIGNEMKPKDVKRVTDIFEKPQFYINGPTAGDVRQGRDGDCYLMAALCGLGNMEGLIDRVCVKHDVQVGVYGFIFHRDGEWQQTIVDDKLYLRAPDYDEALDERTVWDDITRVDSEEEYRKAHQTGSRALYFAQCSDENETWLPLLEKAYAKAHGDFTSIDGGFTGEAIEDLTGGVTTEIYSSDILDKDDFWHNDLMRVNKEFLFGCATGFYSNWLDTSGRQGERERQGIDEHHAYSIMEAREVKGKRLLKVRNPWGRKEWEGKWSDGSAEWDAEWMQLLGHKFGNDGVFWIEYADLLKKYQHFDRTRIFTKEWTVSQAWVGVDVGWSPEYHQTRFLLDVKEKGPVVIVLSQLDYSYFEGLEGCYEFDLQFRLEEAKAGGDPDDYIVRSNGAYAMARSVSTDIELDAGTYVVLMKITATRELDKLPVEEVLAEYVEKKREKLIQIATSYDLSHAKGVYVESNEEKKERKKREEEHKLRQKEEWKKATRQRAEKQWRKQKMRHDRERERERSKRAKNKRRTVPEEASRRGSGSLDVQFGASAVNGDSHREEKQAERKGTGGVMQPMQIKSFSGEVIDTQSPAESRAVPPVPPPSRSMTKEVEGIVQSLDEVVKAAEDNTKQSTTVNVADNTTAEPEQKPPPPIVQINGKDAVTDVKPLPELPPLSTPEHTLPTPPESGPPPPAQQQNGTASHQEKDDGHGIGKQDNFPTSFPLGQFDAHARRDQYFDDAGSVSSFTSFDWNSELDMPSEFESDAPSHSDSDPDSDDVDDGDEDEDEDQDAAEDTTQPDNNNPDTAADKDPRPHSAHSTSSSTTPSEILYKPPSRIPSKPHAFCIRDDPNRLPPPAAEQPDAETEGEEPWNAVCVVGLRVYCKSEVGLRVLWGHEDEEERERRREERKKAKKGKKAEGKDGGKTKGKGKGKGKCGPRYKAKGGKGEKVDGQGDGAGAGDGDGKKSVVRDEVMSPSFKLDPDDQGKGLVGSPTTG